MNACRLLELVLTNQCTRHLLLMQPGLFELRKGEAATWASYREASYGEIAVGNPLPTSNFQVTGKPHSGLGMKSRVPAHDVPVRPDDASLTRWAFIGSDCLGAVWRAGSDSGAVGRGFAECLTHPAEINAGPS